MGTRRLARVGAAAVLTASVLALQGPAGAAEDPVGDLTGQLQDGVSKLSGGGAGTSTTSSSTATGASSPATTSSDSDSPGYETPNPTEPDHASSYVAQSQLADQELVTVGSSNATIEDDGTASSSTTMLALGGTAIPLAQTQASSDGSNGQESDTLGPLTEPICEGSGGGVCLDVLYAESTASEDGSSSSASSKGGLASACLGGSDTTGETCDGQVQAGAGSSYADIHRDNDTGAAAAESGSELLGLCVGAVGDGCGVGAHVARSEGRSTSSGTPTRHSEVLGLEAGGQSLLALSDPFSVALAPECDPDVACVFANQGETYVGSLRGHSQIALALRLLEDLVDLGVGQSETLVHAAAVQAPQAGGQHAGGTDGGGGGAQAGAAAGAGVLPNTGGVVSGLLALGLLLVGLGAGAVAWERRATG